MVRVLLVTAGLSCTSARETKGRRQCRRWLTVVPRRMVRGLYVRDNPPRGGEGGEFSQKTTNMTSSMMTQRGRREHGMLERIDWTRSLMTRITRSAYGAWRRGERPSV